jgi:hypothetical protein
MRKPWAEPFENREEMRSTLSPMGLAGHICLFLGAVFAILGIVSDAANATLGLEPMSWLVLAIIVLVAGMPMWLTWGISMHLLGMEAKSKKKE